MSCDRIIRFTRNNPRPALKVLRMFLEDFVATAGTITWGEDRFYVNFNGPPSHAFRRCDTRGAEFGEQYHAHMSSDHGKPRQRWIEVWSSRSLVYVMTRDQDQFVNGVAEAIAVRIAGRWGGEHGES